MGLILKLFTKLAATSALITLAVLLSPPAWAQFKPSYTIMKTLDIFDVKANGEFSQITERLFRVDTPQGIKDMGEQRIDYNEKMETLEILEAYTLLPDGSRTDVPADKIKRLDGDGAEEYSDSKVLAIIFPKVDVGSLLYYKARSYQHTPYFPGQFFWAQYFSPHVAFENVEVQLVHAPEVKLLFDTGAVKGGRVDSLPEDAPGSIRYRFTYKQDKAYPVESGQAALSDFAPYLAFTTFANYAELGKAYQARAKPMAAVTPAINALAKELTAGVTDERAKVRKLYNWVSRNIRYVAVYVAEGGFVPHSAQSILDNRYGDCKDHVTLLEALLSAVGIESTTALINSGDAMRIPKLAISTPFNHVITYIPKFDLYLDSTSQFTPMGSLPDGDTGKPTLLTATGTMGQTPHTWWQKDYSRVKVKMILQKDGSVAAKSTWTSGGVEEVSVRGSQFAYKNRDPQELSTKLLTRSQESGWGEFLKNDPLDLDKPLIVQTVFELDTLVNVPGPSAMTIPHGLVPGNLRRMASYKPPTVRRFPVLCGSRELSESISLTFPDGVLVERVPPDVQSKNGPYYYAASYKLVGQELQVERAYSSRRKTGVCNSTDDKHWNAFRAVLQRDLRGQVFFK
jgi:transglutaminase-like putative cysteine protease